MYILFDWIMAAERPGMAANKTFEAFARTLEYSVFLDCLIRVFGAGGTKFALAKRTKKTQPTVIQ